MRPVEAGAGHRHRPLGPAQELRGPLHALCRAGRARVEHRSRLRLGHRCLCEHVIQREVQERGPGGRLEGGRDRLVDQPRDRGRGVGGTGQLGERRDEWHVVDLLERSHPPAARRRTPAQHQHRRAVGLRRRQRAHAVGHARSGSQRADADPARGLRPTLRGEGRRLLVAHVHDVDALLAAAVVDREEVAAGQREELRDARGSQPLRDEPTAVDLLLLGLGGHRSAGYRAAPARRPARARSPP